MSLQSLFEKSENASVALVFALFIISHFGLLFLLGVV